MLHLQTATLPLVWPYALATSPCTRLMKTMRNILYCSLMTLQGGFDSGLSSLPLSPFSSSCCFLFSSVHPSRGGHHTFPPSLWKCHLAVPCGINICKLQPTRAGTSCLNHREPGDQAAENLMKFSLEEEKTQNPTTLAGQKHITLDSLAKWVHHYL